MMSVSSSWITDDQSDSLTLTWDISFVDQSFITVVNNYTIQIAPTITSTPGKHVVQYTVAETSTSDTLSITYKFNVYVT